MERKPLGIRLFILGMTLIPMVMLAGTHCCSSGGGSGILPHWGERRPEGILSCASNSRTLLGHTAFRSLLVWNGSGLGRVVRSRAVQSLGLVLQKCPDVSLVGLWSSVLFWGNFRRADWLAYLDRFSAEIKFAQSFRVPGHLLRLGMLGSRNSLWILTIERFLEETVRSLVCEKG
jgi:hypothetical protein